MQEVEEEEEQKKLQAMQTTRADDFRRFRTTGEDFDPTGRGDFADWRFRDDAADATDFAMMLLMMMLLMRQISR